MAGDAWAGAVETIDVKRCQQCKVTQPVVKFTTVNSRRCKRCQDMWGPRGEIAKARGIRVLRGVSDGD